MFVYRPHVHSQGVVTTPDLLVDRVRGTDGEAPAMPTTAVELRLRAGTIAPAGVLVGAGYGALVTVGFEYRADGAAAMLPFGVARTAWRSGDIAAHADRLALRLDAATARLGALVLPARAEMIFVGAAALARPVASGTLEITLADPVHDRTIEHRVHLVLID
jgi:hypothetical protein